MNVNTEEILQKLTGLGFFKYVPDNEIDFVKSVVKDNIEKKGTVVASLIYLPEKHEYIREDLAELGFASYDRRKYSADAEEVAEGRMGSILKKLKTALLQEGVKIEFIDDDFKLDHYNLVIDGNPYEIFKKDKENPCGVDNWTYAHARFIQIVNELLEKAGSKEKLFGIAGGEDAQVILLTQELSDYIKSLNLQRWETPFLPSAIIPTETAN